MKGLQYMTIPMTANKVVDIQYDYNCSLNVINDTTAEIYLSAKSDFSEALKIPCGCSYNGFQSSINANEKFYIKSIGSGDVSIGVRMS